jgi:N-acetylmuramoyl-L-alanine amidase
MREIKNIVIHCSASPNASKISIEEIDGMHSARGFNRLREWHSKFNPHLRHVGYHVVIDCLGRDFTGRHLEEIGAHVQGSNTNSIGICLVGTDKFTPAQWVSLAARVQTLGELFPEAKVCGHRDFSPDLDGDGVIERHEWLKICPGFDVKTWLAVEMQPLAGHVVGV